MEPPQSVDPHQGLEPQGYSVSQQPPAPPQQPPAPPQQSSGPQRSLRKGLSRRGRLENAWASAVADADAHAGLAGLRKVLAGFEERPDRTAELWLSFQQSLLAPRFLPLLGDDDLERLTRTGEQMAAAGRIGLQHSWVPLADAVVARSASGDREFAVSLYTRLYHSPLVHEESRSIAAAALARLDADDDAQLAIYVDVLRRYARVPPEVRKLVERALGVGFDDELPRVEGAFTMAGELSAAGLRPAGLDRTLGLGALLLHRRPDDAVQHFTRARAADPGDGEALRGLLAARLHSGAYAQALAEVRGHETALTARGAELVELCRMLDWLEMNPGRDGPPGPATPAPLTAARLAAIGDGSDSRPWGRYALGRAQLLEGTVGLAAKSLSAVADELPDRADIGYHTAWAQLMCGDHEDAVRRCRSLLDNGDAEHAWPLGCLLLDADPGRPPSPEERTAMKSGGAAFTAIVTARLALVEGRRPPVSLAWDPLGAESASVPELLEVLRTLLGAEVAAGREEAAGHLVTLALFERLPLPEQLLWRGLLALPDDREAARTLLQRAHGQGHERAALVRAVVELGAGHADRAVDLLDGVRGPKADLVRARAEAALGRTREARQRLGRLRSPRAHYESGVLGLREAAELWAAGANEQAVQRAEWAAARLTDAQLTGPDALPPVPADARALARAARLLAERATRPGTGRAPWRPVRHHSRTAWLLGLGQLLAEPGHMEPVLAEALVQWSGAADGHPDPDTAGRLAKALGRACLLAESSAAQAELAQVLATFAEVCPLSVVEREAYRAARMLGGRGHVTSGVKVAVGGGAEGGSGSEAGAQAVTGVEADTGLDPLLAMSLAATALETGDRAEAVRLLRAVTDADADADADGGGGGGDGAERTEQRTPRDGLPGTVPSTAATTPADRGTAEVVAFLAQALDGNSAKVRPPDADNPALMAPLLVIQAAGLVSAERARAAETLTLALRDHDLAGLVDLGRVLPALCARAARGRRRGRRSEALAEVVRRLADRLGDDVWGAGDDAGRFDADEAPGIGRPLLGGPPLDLLTLARCAAAAGDHALADDLWRRMGPAALSGTTPIAIEYGTYLCHRAVTAHGDGDPAAALDLLDRAARHLPGDHPAHRHGADLERGDRIDTLLSHLFPHSAQPWERPGRLPVLEAALAVHPVWEALALDEPDVIQEQLTAFFAGRAGRADIPPLHALAVVYREEALAKLTRTGTADEDLVTATALWCLLLSHPGFWESFTDRPAAPGPDQPPDGGPDADSDAATTPEAEDLRTSVTEELLTLHSTHGARALAEHRESPARLHINCLTALREGSRATRTLLAEGPLADVLPGIDEALFAGIAARAGALLDDWAADLVRAAERRVDDPERIRALPPGIDGNYEEGIDALASAVDQGFTPSVVLQSLVEWHNKWQNCLYQMHEKDQMRTVLSKSVRFAELLASQAVEGRPHQRENQLLAAHYVDRGFLAIDTGESIGHFERAQEWNPADTNARELLEQARQEALLDTVLDHIKARRYRLALAELDRIPRDPSIAKSLDRFRVTALIGQAYAALESNGFDEAERAARDAQRVASFVEDARHREDADNALRAVATAMNNRAVAISNAALSAAKGAVGVGPSSLEGQLQQAVKLLRRAERISPAAATRDNISHIEDILRRRRS